MTCRCGESQRTQATHSFRRTVAGTTFTAEASVDACARCGEPNVPAALVIAFERQVAAELARRGPVSGETFRWIRKAASLERMDLAQLLGVPVETIASWEEERRAPDVAAWTVVAAIALDGVEGPRPMRTRLRARQRSGGLASAAAHLEIGSATAGTLRKVLELLATARTSNDTDLAEALDLDLAALRSRLRDLAAAGVVQSTPLEPGAQDEPLHWDVTTRDRPALYRAAEVAGIDLDALLPRARRPDPRSSPRERIPPMNGRASS